MEQAPEFRKRGGRNGEGKEKQEEKKGHEEKTRRGISHRRGTPDISSSKLKTIAQRCLAFTRLL